MIKNDDKVPSWLVFGQMEFAESKDTEMKLKECHFFLSKIEN